VPSTKFKKRNLARYKKTYPFVQRSPRWGLVSDKDVIIEVIRLEFNDENEKTYHFGEVYTQLPIVTATVQEPDDNDAFDSASVSAMVESLDLEKVKVVTSENITGYVNVHVIFIKDYA
jgi:hypothetical protein